MLRADTHIDCHSGEYSALSVAAGAMLLLFVIGLPLWCPGPPFGALHTEGGSGGRGAIAVTAMHSRH